MKEREPWVRFYSDCPVAMVFMGNGTLSGSEVELGLLYWCNSGDVLKMGAMIFCTGSSVPNPAPIILFTKQ